LSTLCSKIRRERARGNCGIAFVDYIGLVKGVGREQRYREVADITGEFKSLAMDLEIPIVALCQLSRLITRENRPPELSDLRESGDIEQDADIVLMLEPKDGDINLWIRKNRQYKKDFPIRLRPNDTYSKFYELTQNDLV
jgi:replicative DNA helicase